MKRQMHLLFIISIFTISAFSSSSIASEKTLGVEVYVWQRDWNPYVQKAIKEATEKIKISSFMVLTGDYVYESESENLNFKAIPVNWSYFSSQAKVTIVLRINAQASKLFSKRKLQPIIDKIGSHIQASIEYAKSKGVNIIGVQLDYDCPTSKLKDYQRLLIGLRKKFPQLSFSITVLPTWLADKDFKQLLKPASFYVLQVHSFERPARISDALEIFSKEKVPFYIKQASSFNIPYYVSLPTYGYELGFDEAGNFIGIRAEGPPIAWDPKCQRKFMTSDPEKIVSLLKYLKASKPLNCLGVVWFRLPLETDEFNWAWPTFAAVIAGRLPKKSFKTEIVSPKPKLFEVWVQNIGEANVIGRIAFEVVWGAYNFEAWDLLGGYQMEYLNGEKNGSHSSHGIRLIGPAPKVGQKLIVAWFRVSANAKNKARDNLIKLKLGDVQIYGEK